MVLGVSAYIGVNRKKYAKLRDESRQVRYLDDGVFFYFDHMCTAHMIVFGQTRKSGEHVIFVCEHVE